MDGQVIVKSGLRAAAERAAAKLEQHTESLYLIELSAMVVTDEMYRKAVRDLADLLKSVEGNLDAFEYATGTR